MTWVCRCGRKIPYPTTIPFVYRCPCGRKWIWKIRAKKYVFAGWWK